MKTIEQACQEYTNQFSEVAVSGTEITYTIEELNLFSKDDFRSGIEFAQQWNPIKETPPEDAPLIVKTANGIYGIGIYSYRFGFIINIDATWITHYRLIELK